MNNEIMAGQCTQYLIKSKTIDFNQKTEIGDYPVFEVESVDLSKFIHEQSPFDDSIRSRLDVEGREYNTLKKMLADGRVPLAEKLYTEFHWQKMGMRLQLPPHASSRQRDNRPFGVDVLYRRHTQLLFG